MAPFLPLILDFCRDFFWKLNFQLRVEVDRKVDRRASTNILKVVGGPHAHHFLGGHQRLKVVKKCKRDEITPPKELVFNCRRQVKNEKQD